MAEFQYLDGGNSEAQDMQAESYLYASSGTTGIAATGAIEGLKVTQTLTASGSVLIDAGACLVQASLGPGGSRLVNPSQKTLDIFTANPVGGLPRNDIVVFDSVTKTIAVIVGTPNATPADPTVPATALALARLRHAASAPSIPTASIDSLVVYTGLRGVPVRVASQAARNATFPTPGDGQQVYRLDTHAVETYNGVTGWAVMAVVADTGWINAGFTPASGFTITSQVARRYNGVVAVQLNMVSISAIAAGNITNVDVVNIPVGWGPVQLNGHLGGGPSSGGHTSYASASAQTIVMTATDTGFLAGAGFYVLGMWML